MKTFLRSTRYTLSVCAAAAIFDGCGGSTVFPNPVTPTFPRNAGTVSRLGSPSYAGPGRISSDSSSAEILSGSARVKQCLGIPPLHADFHANGTATGPYPGTFTAKGWWQVEGIGESVAVH
jgi:hypothetical protein